MLNIDETVKRYVLCRNLIRELKERQEKEMLPLKEKINQLTGELEAHLDQSKSESVRTKEGTFYRSVRYSASLADPQIFMDFVLENKQWQLLDRKANVTAVRDYAAKKAILPPGVNLSSITIIGVRAPGAKKEDSDNE